jgi:hypothetical protein
VSAPTTTTVRQPVSGGMVLDPGHRADDHPGPLPGPGRHHARVRAPPGPAATPGTPGRIRASSAATCPAVPGPGGGRVGPPRRGTSTYGRLLAAEGRPGWRPGPAGWRRAAVGPSSSGSTTSTRGLAARSAARSGASSRHWPACIAASASADGTVPVSTHSARPVAARRSATSRAWNRGVRCSLWAKLASSSTTTQP